MWYYIMGDGEGWISVKVYVWGSERGTWSTVSTSAMGSFCGCCAQILLALSLLCLPTADTHHNNRHAEVGSKLEVGPELRGIVAILVHAPVHNQLGVGLILRPGHCVDVEVLLKGALDGPAPFLKGDTLVRAVCNISHSRHDNCPS